MDIQEMFLKYKFCNFWLILENKVERWILVEISWSYWSTLEIIIVFLYIVYAVVMI